MSPGQPAFPAEAVGTVCPACGTPQTVRVRRIFDAADPGARSELLGGRFNTVTCQACGAVHRAPVPVLYHDAAHEAALVLLPSLEMPRDEQEREIGRLTNRALEALPPEQRKMYLLQPTTFISEQSFVDAVRAAGGRAADGTRAGASPDDEPAPAEAPTHDELIEGLQEAKAAGELDGAVALLRPALDYGFYATLTARIEAAPESAAELTALRSDILAAADRIDEAARTEVESAVEFLQSLLAAENPAQRLEERSEDLSPAFFLVLDANIAAAREDGRDEIAMALGQLRDAALASYEATLPPRDRLVNQLARADSAEARAALLEGQPEIVDDELDRLLAQATAQARDVGADDVAANLAAAAEHLAAQRAH